MGGDKLNRSIFRWITLRIKKNAVELHRSKEGGSDGDKAVATLPMCPMRGDITQTSGGTDTVATKKKVGESGHNAIEKWGYFPKKYPQHRIIISKKGGRKEEGIEEK